MILRCTKEVMPWLHYDWAGSRAVYDDLYAWGADIIGGEDLHYYLLLRNSATGFALLFEAADGERFSSIRQEAVIDYLRQALTAQGFDSEDVAFYLQEGEHCTCTKKFESAYERKKLKDLSAWVLETGLSEAQKSISSLPVTVNRRKVDAKALFADLLKERRKEITKHLYLAASVKVHLRLYSQYNVWRRFHLPLDLTYGSLHDIIQVAFGWDGSHLHEFKIGKHLRLMPGYGIQRDFLGEGEFLDEDEVTLAEVSAKKMTYTYDFGDYWTHDIMLEEVLTVEEKPIPICVAGEGSAPWEDCGGAWGYHSLLESLADPDDPNHAYARSWAGLGYWDGAEDDEDEEVEEEEKEEEEEGNDGTPFDQGMINASLSRMFQ